MVRLASILTVLSIPVCAHGAAPEIARVSYETADGVKIVADYYLPKESGDRPAPVVILLHQYPSTRSSWEPHSSAAPRQPSLALGSTLSRWPKRKRRW